MLSPPTLIQKQISNINSCTVKDFFPLPLEEYLYKFRSFSPLLEFRHCFILPFNHFYVHPSASERRQVMKFMFAKNKLVDWLDSSICKYKHLSTLWEKTFYSAYDFPWRTRCSSPQWWDSNM